jgi:hypothetical protein
MLLALILKKPFDQYPTDSRRKASLPRAILLQPGNVSDGGEYWSEFYSQLAKSLLKSQPAGRSWILTQSRKVVKGPSNTLAKTILAPTPQYQMHQMHQMLPIFRRRTAFSLIDDFSVTSGMFFPPKVAFPV